MDMNSTAIDRYNRILHTKLSTFLNYEPDYIKGETVGKVTEECDLDSQDAYAYLLANAMYMDPARNETDRELFALYFYDMIRELDAGEFESDPYMLEIVIPRVRDGRWELGMRRYRPFEAFVRDDFVYKPDGRVIPQIGYFTREYEYPCVLQDGREWMLITPNEINTMRGAISHSHGRVLTFGLGLGYFAFMSARKDNVESVTVVECDESVILLFERYILPQMSCREKIRVVCDDAYSYAENKMKEGKYDFVFSDIWHDPSDGVEAYKRLKSYEHQLPCAEFAYWIEDTMKYYL